MEVTALKQTDEAGLGAEWIPLGVYGEEGEVYVVRLKGTFEMVEGKIEIPQASVNESEGIGRDEALRGLGDGLEGLQDVEGFGSAVHFREEVAAK